MRGKYRMLGVAAPGLRVFTSELNLLKDKLLYIDTPNYWSNSPQVGMQNTSYTLQQRGGCRRCRPHTFLTRSVAPDACWTFAITR